MNDWMDEFISRCLADVPWGRCRRRMAAELRDHMKSLRQDLTEEEILQTMGDPERLRREYCAAWNRSAEGRISLIANSSLVIWFSMFTVGGAMSSIHLLQDSATAAVVSLYLVPFVLGAAFLRVCLKDEPHLIRWVTLGLLHEWIWGAVTFVGMYGLMASNSRTHITWDAPWLISYLLATLIGCLILGQIFGRANGRKCKLA